MIEQGAPRALPEMFWASIIVDALRSSPGIVCASIRSKMIERRLGGMDAPRSLPEMLCASVRSKMIDRRLGVSIWIEMDAPRALPEMLCASRIGGLVVMWRLVNVGRLSKIRSTLLVSESGVVWIDTVLVEKLDVSKKSLGWMLWVEISHCSKGGVRRTVNVIMPTKDSVMIMAKHVRKVRCVIVDAAGGGLVSEKGLPWRRHLSPIRKVEALTLRRLWRTGICSPIGGASVVVHKVGGCSCVEDIEPRVGLRQGNGRVAEAKFWPRWRPAHAESSAASATIQRYRYSGCIPSDG